MKNAFRALMVISLGIATVFTSCKHENLLPDCTITNPTQDTMLFIGGNFEITTVAEDSDGTIIEVKYSLNDINIGMATAAPYQIVFNTNIYESGEYKLKATAKDNDGALCFDEVNITLHKARPPYTNFSFSPTKILTGAIVTFVDETLNNPSTWFWTIGDIITSTIQNPEIAIDQPGIYDVTLMTGNDDGTNSYTIPHGLVVLERIHPEFTADIFYGHPPMTVNFKNLTTGDVEMCSWHFGDGITSNLWEPNHKYEHAGEYTVRLYTRNDLEDTTIVKENFIVVAPHPPSLWLPGGYQGWYPTEAPTVVDIENDGTFTGLIEFPENFWNNFEFKFTSEPNWNGTIYGAGENAGELSIGGGTDNLEVPGAGTYLLTVDINALTWTYEMQ